MAAEKLKLEHIVKAYGKGKVVIPDFSVSIGANEFVVLLGPSGCGKSTLLRIIAGLEPMDSGDIYMDGHCVNAVPPRDRDISMVFQNYALYPHMTVYKNISVSLKLRHVPDAEITQKVEAVAQMLDIADLLGRRPRQLSGGQMQRVALARAIVREPSVFLMDEPLSNLDAALRMHTRSEIIKLYHRLQTTTIYVTHDQVEALTMATRIILLKDGMIQQQGTPADLYDRPANLFAAGFIGTPPMNFFPVVIRHGQVVVLGQKLTVQAADQEAVAGIRPEHLLLTEGDAARVEHVENLGSEQFVFLRVHSLQDLQIEVKCPASLLVQRGQQFGVSFTLGTCHLFNKETGKRLIPS
jgi:multiple sugar transport system ATP-binding protein